MQLNGGDERDGGIRKLGENTEFPTELPSLMQRSKGVYKKTCPFRWMKCPVSSDDMCRQVLKLLKDNYSEMKNGECVYSKEFLRWALQPPGYKEDWIIGVRQVPNGTLVGFLSAVPAILMVDNTRVEMAEINVLCVMKQHRGNGIATAMMKELTRRVGQRVFITSKDGSSALTQTAPTVSCPYFYKLLIHSLPVGGEDVGESFREMTVDDVPSVTKLLDGYLTSRFKVRPVFDEKAVSHWFLPRNGIVSSFVRARGGKLTDFGSFYWQRLNLPRWNQSHLRNPQVCTLEHASMLYYATTESVENLIRSLMKLAKELGLQVFGFVGTMELKQSFMEELNFEKAPTSIHYHLPSCVAEGVKPSDIGLLIKALE